jgi:site-specific DNA recombinase
MKTIALYARVSSDKQAKQATIESQVAALQQRAQADGHRVLPTDLYIDDGYSGATLKRPALERLRDRVAEGAIELLYVHSPDRLARRYAYQVLLLEEFHQKGVQVVFLLGPAGRTAEDELLVQVQGMFSEYERAKLMERYRRGKLHKAQRGLISPLSGAPYGYRYIPRSDQAPASYQVLLHEARVVRQVFDWLVHDQISIAEICRRLEAQKIPTRTGKLHWDRTTVWGMLQNPAYVGKAAYGKTESVERGKLLRPLRNRPTCGRALKTGVRDRPAEQWLFISVPALVDPDVFESAQQQLQRNRRLAQRNQRGQRYLLQGLTVCALCQYAFYGKLLSRSAQKGPVRYGYYRCVGSDGYRFAGGRVCTNKQVRVEHLDQYVWDSVRQVLQEPERVLSEWTRRGQQDGELARLAAQRDEARAVVAGLERSLVRLLDAYEVGAMDLEELRRRSERVRARLSQAQRDAAEVDATLSQTVELKEVAGRVSEFASQVTQGLDAADFLTRRQIVRALVARVEIDEQGATVVYRIPGPRHDDGTQAPVASPVVASSDSASCQLRGGRDYAPLWDASLRRNQALDAASLRFQHALHHPQHPPICYPPPEQRHHLIVLYRSKVVFQIGVDDPLPACLYLFSDFAQGVLCRASSAVSEAGFIEFRLEDRL